MTKSFRTYVNRLDRDWTVFAADDAPAMERAISCNARAPWKRSAQGSPMVPTRAAADVIADLKGEGWTVK